MNIGYDILGSCIFSKDFEIVLKCIEILSNIKNEIGFNWNWFINEGINSFIFVLLNMKINN